ncbi:hypothetical protein KP509_1Z296900 [Ceratopteris richardii]|nr:hypothetical protein KP509_1Z296900 [Ceratopteris richardii]
MIGAFLPRKQEELDGTVPIETVQHGMHALRDGSDLTRLNKSSVGLRQLCVRSSVALKLWQPEIVRLVQEQVVRQQPIDPQFRHYSLEMEAKVCREEIKKCRRRIDRNRLVIEKSNKDLEFLTYNPTQNLHEDVPQKRMKKLKTEKQSF